MHYKFLTDESRVPAQYRARFRENLKRYEAAAEDRKPFDIVVPPEESIPTNEFDFAATATNWGVELLLPEVVKEELRKRIRGRIVVKVFDTAGRSDHPDLQRRQLPGSNYSSSPSLDDNHGHGTHVGGIIAAKSMGMLDVLFEAGLADIKFVKTLNDSGSASWGQLQQAIAEEEKENAELRKSGFRVVSNFSLGGGTAMVEAVDTEYRKSVEAGTFHVAAAGNTGAAIQYPGISKHTFAVTSLDQNGGLSNFSGRGPESDHCAPGRNITSAWRGGGYATLSGTSMACPFLTALTAIAVSVYPEDLQTQEQVKLYFQRIGIDLGNEGRDDLYGWGLIMTKKILDIPPIPRQIERELRTIYYVLSKPYFVGWQIEGQVPAMPSSSGLYVMSLGFGTAGFYVSDIEVGVRTRKQAQIDGAAAAAAADNFFSGRLVITKPNTDFRDAVIEVMYGLSLAFHAAGLSAVVNSVVVLDDSGTKARLYRSDLRHYIPSAKPPAPVL